MFRYLIAWIATLFGLTALISSVFSEGLHVNGRPFSLDWGLVVTAIASTIVWQALRRWKRSTSKRSKNSS